MEIANVQRALHVYNALAFRVQTTPTSHKERGHKEGLVVRTGQHEGCYPK